MITSSIISDIQRLTMQNILLNLGKKKFERLSLLGLVLVSVFTTYNTYQAIWVDTGITGPNPSVVMSWMLSDLVTFLAIIIFCAYKIFKKWLGIHYNSVGSKLQNRIILMFCLVAAIPTITISIFSAYFFNFGIQSWFDNKIQSVLDQSVTVAQSYITEHKMRLKDTALSMADDLSNMYYDLMHHPELFNKVLDGQIDMRSLNEAIVFQKATNTILARASLSFALAFSSIPLHLLEQASQGDVVEIKSDPSKIRMLIKLQEYNDAYLLIGRLIDRKVIDHIDKTHGAADEYWKLKKLITEMQIKFAGIFILVTMILMVFVMICAIIFAAYIIVPIRRLVMATEDVKAGDLSVRVQAGSHNDEIGILSNAFNRMVQQIDKQQKDLIIAQRALAWSDVARRVAHEIKNPLTPIQLSAERLLKVFSTQVTNKEDFTKYISTILRNAQDIGKIVNEFVNFAKMPSPTFEKIEFIELIRSAVESHKIIHDKITYILNSDIDRLDAMCDITQISQVMGNLLKNAAEALECTDNKVITVSIQSDSENIYLIVQDTGKGFPVELMDVITEPYVTTRSKGTGLGLSIVKKIVQDHGGILEISNNNGGCVTLTFDRTKLTQNRSTASNTIDLK